VNQTNSEILDKIFRRAEEASEVEGRDVHVVELLESYVVSRPHHARAWSLYGNALRELGRNGESLDALKKAYQLAAEGYKGFVAMHIAILIKDFRSPNEARKWFDIGTKIIGTAEGWPWILRGANLSVLGEFDAAIACFETVIENNHPEKDEALLNLGLVYRALGKYDQATLALKRALELNPNYNDARIALDSLAGISEVRELLKHLKPA
jgi:tetratricopeptide (TPR) repeat protein